MEVEHSCCRRSSWASEDFGALPGTANRPCFIWRFRPMTYGGSPINHHGFQYMSINVNTFRIRRNHDIVFFWVIHDHWIRVIQEQWEFQDPKMEVLYHVRPYFVVIFPYICLTKALDMVGTSNLGSSKGH